MSRKGLREISNNAWRALMLAGAILCVHAVPANAATRVGSVHFAQTTSYVDPRLGDVLPYALFYPEGSFSFDTVTNRVTSFVVDGPRQNFSQPLNLTDEVNQLLQSNHPCGFGCFVEAINQGSWSYYAFGNGYLDIAFSTPLTGSVGGQVYDGSPPYTLNFGGTLLVTTPVPEPATWALMIVGFGLLGNAFRQRSKKKVLVFG